MVEMQTLENENYGGGGGGYYDGQSLDQQSIQRPTTLGQGVGNQVPRQRKRTITNDVIDNMCSNFNQDLLISKTFYFFFFSAFGSLFPLMAVYFKQLGMNASQSGILIGIRPLIEFLSAPFWGSLADRFKKGRAMILFSLTCWIIFTLSLSFVQPPASSCVMYNRTHHVLYTPSVDRSKRSYVSDEEITESKEFGEWMIGQTRDEDETQNSTDGQPHYFGWSMRQKRQAPEKEDPHKLPPGYVVGLSPGSVEYTLNYKKDKHVSYVSPAFSSMVYKKSDVQEVFFLILLLVVIGEFFSAPAITVADTVTLSYLAENPDNYGKQRMFGSLGWGLAMFFVGVALDQSTSFMNHPCVPHDMERNYTICFATFSVLMGCALLASTQFKFSYEDDLPEQSGQVNNIPLKPMSNGPDLVQTAGGGITTTAVPLPTKEPPKTDSPMGKSKVFAQTTKKIPEVLIVLKTFANVRYGSFLYVAWFMGFGIGLVFTFLFWHLQDLGGTPTLFGVASVINHISEIFAYFFSFKFIRQIGHVKVLCVGLAGNVARFLYISWLRNPWWVLPFEFIQGITHAAVWAACCSYITQATPPSLRTSAQGVLQGLHHGLGRGCGAVIGGIFVTYFGTQITFRGYGFACMIVLLAFVFINYYRKDSGFQKFSDEPQEVIEETSHLAPHGVPANPMPRALSKQNIGEEKGQNYYNDDSYYKDPNLNVPKYDGHVQQSSQNTNPFNSSNYGGHQYSSFQAKSGWDDSVNGDVYLSSAPSAQTRMHNPQPGNNKSDYDW
ncbi:MFSD6 (predicted) [Pycnogonum litorale]